MTLRRFYFFTSALLLSISPLAIAAIVGLSFYPSLPPSLGVIVIIGLTLAALWFSVWIFKQVNAVGPISFLSHTAASPDLDHLEPEINSITKRRSPSEFVELVNTGKSVFKGGSIKIYGDWFGAPYEEHFEILSAAFDRDRSMLSIDLESGMKIDILHPQHLFESPTFLKVIRAKEITIRRDSKDSSAEKVKYSLDGQKIFTKSNATSGYKSKFTPSLGDPALMMYA